jgi:hypothetical protein
MKLFKSENIAINTDNIVAIEVIDQLNTRVHMHNGSMYDIKYPFDTLIELLEQPEKDKEANEHNENIKLKGLMKNMNAVYKTSGFFAG